MKFKNSQLISFSLVLLLLGITVVMPANSNTDPYFKGPTESEKIQNFSLGEKTTEESFVNPVVLLVGLGSDELSYREISNISGFDFFTVPYGTDVNSIIAKVQPAQVIIKHPSGFCGLYTNGGQLVRGVETIGANETQIAGVPSSIVRPEGENQKIPLYYPGSQTGTVPHGGLGYVPPPTKPTVKGHLIMLFATGVSSFPFFYVGNYQTITALDGERQLFPYLVSPLIPNALITAASYAQAKNDQQGYDNARTQPRDYMFQPVFEDY